MLTIPTPRTLGLALAVALLCAGLVFARPPLATEMARLIESQGVDAARESFAELWENAGAEYEPDVDGLAELGTRYLREGNIDAGMAVMEMVSIISLAELDTALESQAALVAEMEAAATEIAAGTGTQAGAAPGDERPQPAAPDRGPARTDLERLTGIYASGEAPNRELFVTRTCDGFLVVGPLWADTAPWYLRSEGEAAFTFRQDELQFQLEFATGDDGAARQLSHTIRGLATPMQRRGPLPGDWPRCTPAAEMR
ncbi:hypothetical protein Q6D67_13580 [Haliea sp. E1-2-M8]|uniref:hypothetical protein n=1 Tax=Haliea sp. E1-2-M8 TaxID=3064706 RepID=UPI002725E98B|nr:hypothetical protein [Haliea sp. E1-2-M8]MDO8862736.1 hypothetical protein [Haliea sp. E1-2-M8]